MTTDTRDTRLRLQAADILADRMREVQGTETFVIIEIAYTYMQFQGLRHGDAVGLHLELPSNDFLPAERKLSADAEAALVDIGFAAPEDDDLPNFYVMFGHGHDEEEPDLLIADPHKFDEAIDEVASGAVDALIDVYGFDARLVAAAMGVKMQARAWRSGPPPATDRKGLIKGARLPQVEAAFAAALSEAGDPDDLALFFARVDKRQPDRLRRLLALAPASATDPAPIWWQHAAGGWAPNPYVADMLAWDRHYRLRPLEGAAAHALGRDLLGNAGIRTGS